MRLIEEAAKAAYRAYWSDHEDDDGFNNEMDCTKRCWIAAVEAAMKVMASVGLHHHLHQVVKDGEVWACFRSPEDAELFRRAKERESVFGLEWASWRDHQLWERFCRTKLPSIGPSQMPAINDTAALATLMMEAAKNGSAWGVPTPPELSTHEDASGMKWQTQPRPVCGPPPKTPIRLKEWEAMTSKQQANYAGLFEVYLDNHPEPIEDKWYGPQGSPKTDPAAPHTVFGIPVEVVPKLSANPESWFMSSVQDPADWDYAPPLEPSPALQAFVNEEMDKRFWDDCPTAPIQEGDDLMRFFKGE